jgi:hypothetical protein
MKTIELLNSDGVAYVDDSDRDRVTGYRWRLHEDGYAVAGGGKTFVRMHRLIFGTARGQQVDHIDRNRLNNQRANLRAATASQNAANRGLRSNNTTGYKGVVLVRKSGRYQARTMVSGACRSLGHYDTALEAAVVYDRVVTEIHGEFAATNKSLGLIP